MTLSLNDLPFIDLYVRLDKPDQAYFRSKEKGKGHANQLVPAEFQLLTDRFASAVREKMGEGSDGAIDFDSIRCRLSRQKMSDETVWACARRINTVIPDLDNLGIAPHIAKHMKTLGRRDGLILISGATGHGKTTTAVGLVAHFLKNFGGTAVTIEDPVEYMLKGRHGPEGQCFQVEVNAEEEWAICLKRALRWAPRYIYVGEIRTPKAAEQLLRAATTGHLVITTVHAGSLEEALMGITFLAEQAMGPGVQNILAAGLTGLVHQTMVETGPFMKYLFTEPDSPGDPIRSLIRENKIGMISTYVDRINARLHDPAAVPQSFAPSTKAFIPTAPGATTTGKPPVAATTTKKT
ncbi:MAG: ATPase, T2SS/T4P/T4SS family [Alphaproteobacteria bacterium]|nr:ATPase, T2SS/T4P/T4SS family [Alphaproteobacteria bacterium]